MKKILIYAINIVVLIFRITVGKFVRKSAKGVSKKFCQKATKNCLIIPFDLLIKVGKFVFLT